MNAYQEPKYEIRGDKLVNRQSGEAIPEDEPIIVFRARDKHAAELLVIYARMCQDPQHQEAARRRAAQFSNWASIHPDRMKEPDTKMDEGWTTAGKKPA